MRVVLPACTDPHEAGEHPGMEGPTDPQQQLQHGLPTLLVNVLFSHCSFLQAILMRWQAVLN